MLKNINNKIRFSKLRLKDVQSWAAELENIN